MEERNVMQNNDKKYKEQRIISTELLIPRNTYQRELNTDRVHKIVKQFDERVANEPKVSFRAGNYGASVCWVGG